MSPQRRLFRLPWRTPDRIRRDVDDEVAFHLEMVERELVARGLAPDAAREEARRRFGDLAHARETLRAEGRRRERALRVADLLGAVAHDAGYAARTLRKSPGYVAVVVLALALGIGATAAAFSVLDGVLLRPLPYREPGRLVAVYSAQPRGADWVPPSYADFLDWRERSTSFERIAFTRGELLLLRGTEGVERILAGLASEGLLPLLGTTPVLGRGFTEEEERGLGGRVVILGHALWTSRFGADPRIVGQTIVLDDLPYDVVGVMPRGFRYPAFAQLWTPLAPFVTRDPGLMRRDWRVDNRVVGLLAAGTDAQRARAELSRIAARLAEEHPATNAEWEVAVHRLRDEVVGDVRDQLAMLLGAALLVLLIACFNVANISLVRATIRARELAVRAALGAGRRRLVRQLLVESVLLAAAGGALGVLFAAWAVGVFVQAGPGLLPRLDEVAVDGRVLALGAIVAVLAALAFGTLPALRSARLDLAGALRDGAPAAGGTASAGRLRSALVVTQIALALTLLAGAALLLKSFRNLLAQDPGFRVERLVTMRLIPPQTRYDEPAANLALYDAVRAAVEALPGVTSAAVVNHLPPAGVVTPLRIPGHVPNEGERPIAMYRMVSDGYFATMEIPLRAGRGFESRDMSPASTAIVVNELLATTYWPNESALGRRITVFRQAVGRAGYGTPIEAEVVGVVATARAAGPEFPPAPEVYLPMPADVWHSAYLTVRTGRAAPSMIDPVRRAVLRVEPDLPVDDLVTMEQRLKSFLAQRRLLMTLLGAFAAVALALAAVGIYGVVSYAVSQRTREIGIRMALGAAPRAVLAGVLRDGLRLAALGVALGTIASFWLTRLLAGMLFEVQPADPGVFAWMGLLLLLVAITASLLPARRAARVDPMRAIRSD